VAGGHCISAGGSQANADVAAVDWDRLLVALLHEDQLHIIEAMRWIDQPLSAVQLVQVLDESLGLPHISYHLRRLRKHRLIETSWTRRVRGARQTFYCLNVVGEAGTF
jgi:DNA-binding transcriptional ArsR family regulator